jgi:hypothetical protein
VVNAGLHRHTREKLLEILNDTPEERLMLLTVSTQGGVARILIKVEGDIVTLKAEA